ncbi:MAG: hypothetical protein C4294_19030 [Nitrospiraceae bacterium]
MGLFLYQAMARTRIMCHYLRPLTLVMATAVLLAVVPEQVLASDPPVYGENIAQSRWHWLSVVSLYTISAVSTATILGALLGFLGRLILADPVPASGRMIVIGLLSLLYALHELDLELLTK